MNFVSGNLSVATTTVTNAGNGVASQGVGIQVLNTATGGTMNFGNTTVNGSGNDGVRLGSAGSGNAGNITFADLDIVPDASQKAFVAFDNTGTITATTGDITTAGNRAVDIDGPAGRTPINLNFTNITTSGVSNSISLVDVSGTKFQVTATTQINTRAGTGIFVDNSTATTIQFGTTNIPNPNAAGGYGIRVEDSSSSVTVATATISDPNVTSAQQDSNTDGIPDTDGDGDAIFLTNNTGSFTLNGGTLSNCGNDCIDLRNASNLVLSGVNISAPGQDVTSATGQGFGGHGIWAFNLTGTSSITGGTISGFNVGNRDGATFTNQVSTALTLSIQGTTFQNATGNRGLGIAGQGTSNMTVTVGGPTNNVATNCTFSNILATALQVSAGGAPAGSTSTVNLTVQNSTFQSSPLDGKTNLIGSSVEAGKLTLNILNNTFSNVFQTASTGEALLSFSADGTLAGNTFGATIQGNNINNVGTNNSNCAGGAVRCLGPGNAILVFIDDAANVPNTLVIDNNTLTNTQQGGILVDMANTGAPSSAVNAKIINNCVGKLRSGGTCTGADAPVGAGAGLANGRGIAVERRRNNSLNGNALISGNTVRNGAGQSAGALNTPGIFARTKANSNLSVTITNNNVDTNFVGAAEVRLDTNANDAGDIVAPTQCDDINANTFPAGAGAIIDINETNGTHNVEQASAAAVTAANGGAVSVTPDAGVSFNVVCATPPPAPDPSTTSRGRRFATDTSAGLSATQGLAAKATSLKEWVSNDVSFLIKATEPATAKAETAKNHVVKKDLPSLVKPTQATAKADTVKGEVVTPQEPVSNPAASVPVSSASIQSASNRSRDVRLNHAAKRSSVSDTKPLAPQSGGVVNLAIGTITPGTTVVLTFQVTVNNAAPSGASQISNQGTVTANGGISVLTDDPDIGGASDPTITPLLHPTASNGVISGRIVSDNGTPVEGTVINLSGEQTRKTITDANGNYQFSNVETNGFYTVTPSRANYNFNPFNRSFSQIGNKIEAAFTATLMGDNANPLDTPEYFVRQQYVDILGREPEEGGFNYWSDRILECGGDVACASVRRRDVAAAFFIEQEFQRSGSFIYGLYKGALGRRPIYAEFSSDRQQIVEGPNLETMKQAFAESFVARAEFASRYQANTSAASFVDALLQNVQQNSGIDLSSQRAALIDSYNLGANLNQSRALALRGLAESVAFQQAEYNGAFVLTEYFGYLLRDPEPAGYTFWLDVLSNREPGNFRGMVCAFINSAEYQRRFSAVVSRSDQECGQ